MLQRLLPEWRELWEDVFFSVTAVASEAGLAADNVLRIVEGREGGQNPGIQTVKRIKDALDALRDHCPDCRRPGYKEALRHGSDRRAKKRKKG